MAGMVVRIARSEGWETSPRGVHYFFPQGDYTVPDQMPDDIARRCLNSGIGIEVRTKATKPQNKANGRPRKKKHSKTATGKQRS